MYLPRKINPWQLASEQKQLIGEVTLNVMTRLAVLNRIEGSATVALITGIDNKGVCYIRVKIQSDIALDCQRCFGLVHLSLVAKVELGLIHCEAESKQLPDHYEPLLVSGGSIAINDLVEDELLLALPQIPIHLDLLECESNGYVELYKKDILIPKESYLQPFTALISIKDT
jgi:uncharacterized protein